jgi:hypothetical protein
VLCFTLAANFPVVLCTANLILTSACSSVRRQGCSVNNPHKSALSPAAVASKANRALHAVEADDTRILLRSSTRFVNRRPSHRRLRKLLFAIGSALRHRLEAEKELSHWHLRVCFHRTEPLQRWELYFVSCLHIYLATHDTSRR